MEKEKQSPTLSSNFLFLWFPSIKKIMKQSNQESFQINVDRIETHRWSIIPQLRIKPEGTGPHWALKCNSHFGVPIATALENTTVLDKVPLLSIGSISYLQTLDPLIHVSSALDNHTGP